MYRLRKVDSRRLLRQRPRHRDRPGPDFFALYTQDTDLCRRCAVLFVFLPALTGGSSENTEAACRSSKPSTSCFLFFALGGLAVWAGSEAVLPAYMIGAVLAGTVGKDHALVRRLRTLTFGLLTPFYFIRAGSFVSVPALIAAPATLLILFLAKMASKTAFVFPAVRAHNHNGHAGTYYTLMMSTGLTFGTISALFGLNHQIITQAQYSFLVGTVIASAVLPTLIANTFFLPHHLLPRKAAKSTPPGPALEREG